MSINCNQRHRPPRLRSLVTSVSPFYFITFNTHKRRKILDTEGLHDVFVEFCQNGVSRGIAVGRYVIMPEHVHLFVSIAQDSLSLADWVKALRTVLGKNLLASGIERPHWQEGFFDHVLRSAESYGEKWEYVRMNPVRAGLCERPEEWPYQGEIVDIQFRG